MSATLALVTAALEARYPPRLAAEWDAIGLVCGDPDQVVRSVLFAVDPARAVADEAIELGADLVVAHHPLFLHGVHSVSTATPGGGIVHDLISNGIALLTAHTNADSAKDGVSACLATALGVRRLRPLAADPVDPEVGFGRVGELDHPMTLEEFAAHVCHALPATTQGIRIAGDLASVVRTVAVCGGSGDEYLAAATVAADVYVTSDLRHHRALDHRAAGGCALIDVAHWSGEWTWLPGAARLLADDLSALGITVEVHVSTIPTDPWTSHLGSSE